MGSAPQVVNQDTRYKKRRSKASGFQVEFYVCPVFCDRLRLSLFLYEDKIKAKV